MFGLSFECSQPLSILCLGAHCDDIEIGCGGTILKMLHECKQISCTWITFCSTPLRKKEAEKSAAAFLADSSNKYGTVHAFRDGFLPWLGLEVKEEFEKLKKILAPDLIFTHWRDDFHQDHRLISELTWNTFRDHLILEYEIPKYDGDFGRPNVFVPLTKDICERKNNIISETFISQNQKHWFTSELFMSLTRLRGMEVNTPSGYAEAFHSRKLKITF